MKLEACHDYNPTPLHTHWQTLQSIERDTPGDEAPIFSHALQKMMYLQYERHDQYTWCLMRSHQRHYLVTKCCQHTIGTASLLCIHLS